ncbi:hypothetical protein D3C73_1576330 [compost metagenome]
MMTRMKEAGVQATVEVRAVIPPTTMTTMTIEALPVVAAAQAAEAAWDDMARLL